MTEIEEFLTEYEAWVITGWAIRFEDMWAVRAADLPGLHGPYYRYMTDGRRFYGTKNKTQASIWKYQTTAESFIAKRGIRGEAVKVPAHYAGFVTNDGRQLLRAL